jgi:hypothetical protein
MAAATPSSSSGPGRRPFTAVARVRIPLGVPRWEAGSRRPPAASSIGPNVVRGPPEASGLLAHDPVVVPVQRLGVRRIDRGADVEVRHWPTRGMVLGSRLADAVRVLDVHRGAVTETRRSCCGISLLGRCGKTDDHRGCAGESGSLPFHCVPPVVALKHPAMPQAAQLMPNDGARPGRCQIQAKRMVYPHTRAIPMAAFAGLLPPFHGGGTGSNPVRGTAHRPGPGGRSLALCRTVGSGRPTVPGFVSGTPHRTMVHGLRGRLIAAGSVLRPRSAAG